MKVAIVGGGVAGLATAFEILRHSGATADVAVLEAAPRAGGNLRTERIDGYLCEWGPNGFLDNAPATPALVADLGLSPRVVVSSDAARRRFIYRAGRLHQLPEQPLSFLTSPLLSLRGRLRVLCEPVARRRPQGDETIHAFAARRIGVEAADVFIDSMVSGVFGGNARELSLRACFPKMWEMETEYGGLVRAMLAKRRARGSKPSGGVGAPAGRLTSFAGGVQDLVDGLVRTLGSRVRTSAPVTSLARGAGAWRLNLASGQTLEADAVVLACGSASAASVVEPVDATLAGALREIPSAPMLVVALGFEQATLGHPLAGFGFLVPRGEGLRLLGALWDSSIYPDRAPEGHALLRVMLGGAHDPAAMQLSDPEAVRLARDGLQAAMGIDAQPAFTRVFRHEVGIPQYTVGHLDRLTRIDRALERHPGLSVAGNSYRGVAINACIAEAGPLAVRIVKGSGR